MQAVDNSKAAQDAREVEAVLSDLLDRVALRTPAEKRRARERCTAVDDGVRCPNGGGGHAKPYLCMKHGGKALCAQDCCKEYAEKGAFCLVHSGFACLAEGCHRARVAQHGYCNEHRLFAHKCEWVQRLARLSGLRNQWLDALLREQGGRCARSIVTCAVVAGGAATSVCRWGNASVPRDAVQVDHVVPLCEGGTDDKANLQALCACCHALKSASESRARAAKRKHMP